MTRKHLLLFGIIAAVAVTGCGKNDTKETSASSEITAEDTAGAEEEAENDLEDDTDESEEDLEPITPSDYLVENVSDYVTLGELEGLAVEQYTYDITDDMVQEEIENELEYYGEEVEVDRAAAEGDIVYADVTSTVQGESDTAYTESTSVTLGYADYGADFDSNLIGASAGDTLKFTCSYDDDVWEETWANKSVDFEVTVTGVYELSTPEYDDDFVTEYTDYTSKSDYEDAIREQLSSEYDETSYYDTIEALFQAAIDNSTFSGYPEELYDDCKEEVLSIYGMFLGTMDEQTIYDTFDLSEDEIEEEILETINRRLLITAICEANGIEITEEDYDSFVNDYAEYYGYDSAVSFEEDYTRSSLVWALYEDAVSSILYDAAEITPVAYSDEAELDEFDTESDTEIEEVDLNDVEEESEDSVSENEFTETEVDMNETAATENADS
jgi:trigger factor